jgi:hypothetical protein
MAAATAYATFQDLAARDAFDEILAELDDSERAGLHVDLALLSPDLREALASMGR